MFSIAPIQTIRCTLQHFMNSLTIYSFLCRLNINEKKALNTAKVYERVVHPILYIKKNRDKWS